MRLFEADSRFVDDLETIFRNEIGKSDTKRATKTLSWAALSNLLAPLGFGKINYGTWVQIFDQNPDLKPYVRNFDENGIILGTKQEPEQDEQPVDVPKGPSIDQMASSAVKKGLQPDFK